MLRNKSLTVLQKTYDESYLSCSTAVYYESQGDEIEATRHWKSALEQIYDHNANRALPAYAPRTDTEKALIDALKQLELQCKERIDLLEALRLSRQDDSSPVYGSNKLSKTPSDPNERSVAGKGAIGQGTIPAVSYSDLSRPSLLPRPPLPNRTSSEAAVVGGGSSTPDLHVPIANAPRAVSPNPPPKPERSRRSPSPEKHTMRTTLRSGKAGEKPIKVSRKSAKPAAEGPSKAATLAWGALGSRDKSASRAPYPENGLGIASPNARHSMEQSRKQENGPTVWDSRSRRLVPARDLEVTPNGDSDPFATPRHSDEFSFTRPSPLSINAASSALSSTSNLDASAESASRRQSEWSQGARKASASALQAKTSTAELANESPRLEKPDETALRRSPSDTRTRRKPITRRPVQPSQPSPKPNAEQPNRSRRREHHYSLPAAASSSSEDDDGSPAVVPRKVKKKELVEVDHRERSSSDGMEAVEDEASTWKKKKASILKNLPPGVDESAAKQILNDIVVEGDEVHWSDIAGLEIAKTALREAVVYPFLRPDLFMGLREPTRGMLLFGPPGTGKTMLARAVATESKSTFFSISASSLTSKFLGESEKLVRALFGLARVLAPSIIFVDEIDSLLSQRSGSGEHEATRRIKTEFLIQWSDLQRAAAGREVGDKDKERGDANRVLVLAATNLPWAIDEAARRRFVRRQYIPLPEPTTRETQLRTLLGQQKQDLSNADITRLVELTDGFSGSDITALAKDAAMGPLRSLGEALLQMTMDDIRPIRLEDFEASLRTIRPSVGKAGLKEYEDWAREFGERGG